MKNSENPLSEKKLALFQAVIDLIEEDMDLHSMKVSDITGRAGIGKGTAYEYFSSKEEMVAQAIVWFAEQEFEKVHRMLDEKATLKEQILGILDFIDTEMRGRRCSEQLLKLQNHSCEIKNNFCQEFAHYSGPKKQVEAVLGRLLKTGKEEGSIHPSLPETLAYMVFMSGFMSYFLYAVKGLEAADAPAKMTKNFLCGNMLLAFGNCPEEK